MSEKIDASAEAVAQLEEWPWFTDAKQAAADLLEALIAERNSIRAKLAEAERERDKAKRQYKCYSCKQIFEEDEGHGLASEHFGSALRDPLPKCCEVIDGTGRWGGGPHDPFYRVLKTHYAEIITSRDAAISELAKLRAEAEWRPMIEFGRDSVWLHFRTNAGLGAAIELGAIADQRGDIVRSTINQWINERRSALPTPPKDPAHD